MPVTKAKPAKKAEALKAIEAIFPPDLTDAPDAIRKMRPQPLPAHHADPVKELKRLCQEHATWTRKRVALVAMQSDRVRKMPRQAVVPTPTGPVAYTDIKVGASVLLGSSVAKVTKKTTKGLEISIENTLPDTVKQLMLGTADALDKQVKQLEQAISAELVKFPIYTRFLADAYGLGSGVISAYLVAFVDVVYGGRDGVPSPNGEARVQADPQLVTVSQIVRYCGYAVMNGRLERRTKGVKLGYNSDLRKRLWQWFDSASKNAMRVTRCEAHTKAWTAAGKSTATKKDKEDAKLAINAACATCPACAATEAPKGSTTKYLDLASKTKAEMLADPRYDAEKNTYDGVVGGRMKAHIKGRNKAISLLIEDFYIVSRALAGLPISPARYARQLGYSHGGEVKSKGPTLLSVDAALKLVGTVGKYPRNVVEADDSDDVETTD